MRSYGPRKDPDGVVQHRPVRDVEILEVYTTLWRRQVTGGTITCQLLRRIGGSGRRLVRLVADYEDGDVACQDIIGVQGPLEEQLAAARLERRIIEASRRAAAEQAAARAPSAP